MSTGTAALASKALQDEFNPFLSMAKGFDTAADHLGLDGGSATCCGCPTVSSRSTSLC
jgi:hypothetical protein